MTTSVRLLADRSALRHRAAWRPVRAALALTSVLLGTLAATLLSAGLSRPQAAALAGAPVVVAGDQHTRYTVTPWGSEPKTAEAALTERVRVPRAAVGVVRGVEGVRAVVPYDTFALPARAGAAPLAGRSWEAAALGPYALREGRAPRRAGEVVAGAGLGLRPGGVLAGLRVVGVAEGPAVGYVTAAEARRLAGHPRSADALGVLAAPGVSDAALYSRVRHALDAAGLRDSGTALRAEGDTPRLRVLTGDGRGAVEHLAAAPARTALLELLGSVAASLVLVALLVIASLTAQALHQREDELRMLRAVGATPRQLRAAVGREVTRTAVRPALYGAVAAAPAFLALRAWLASRGALPDGLQLPAPGWLFTLPLATAGLVVGVARIAGWLACARTAKARPGRVVAQGRARRVAGLVLLAAGVSSAGTAATQRGEAAAAAAGAAALTLVAGCALLGPWVAAGAMRVLRGPLRRLGVGGHLAVANGVAHSRRLGAALTPVVLVVAFVCVQLSAAATLRGHAAGQAAAAQRATLAATAPGGFPAGALDRVRAVPGVTAVTAVRTGTVVLARKETGDPRLERLPVLGVTPQSLTHTLDPDVTAGHLSQLRPGTVAVAADRARAQGLGPGATVRLRFDDGAERALKVVAVYERSLALGDFLLSRAQLAGHSTEIRAERALIATGGDAGSAGADAARGDAAEVERAGPDAVGVHAPRAGAVGVDGGGVGPVASGATRAERALIATGGDAGPGGGRGGADGVERAGAGATRADTAGADTGGNGSAGTRAEVRAVLEQVVPGARLGPAGPLEPVRAEGDVAATALTGAAVLGIAGLAALAVLSTLRLVMAGRVGEFALLRGVGATRGQLRRMLGAEAAVIAASGLTLGLAAAALPLLAVSFATVRGLPHLPLGQALALIAGVAVLTAAGIFAPVRRVGAGA